MARPFLGGTKPSVVDCTTASTAYTLGREDSNKVVLVGANAVSIALPNATQRVTGSTYLFLMTADYATAVSKITASANLLVGHVVSADLDGNADGDVAVGANDFIEFGANSKAGDIVEVWWTGAVWVCRINSQVKDGVAFKNTGGGG